MDHNAVGKGHLSYFRNSRSELCVIEAKIDLSGIPLKLKYYMNHEKYQNSNAS